MLPLRLLARLKFVRGSFADPFALAQTRKAERAAIDWYTALIDRCRKGLRPETAMLVGDLLSLPDGVRGYEHVKLATLAATKQKAAELIDRLDQVQPQTILTA
jgi:indolepyruvate ferredoxin oxidoreductase